jgi:hypothetical protein
MADKENAAHNINNSPTASIAARLFRFDITVSLPCAPLIHALCEGLPLPNIISPVNHYRKTPVV